MSHKDKEGSIDLDRERKLHAFERIIKKHLKEENKTGISDKDINEFAEINLKLWEGMVKQAKSLGVLKRNYLLVLRNLPRNLTITKLKKGEITLFFYSNPCQNRLQTYQSFLYLSPIYGSECIQ